MWGHWGCGTAERGLCAKIRGEVSPSCQGPCARACLAMLTRSSSRVLQQVPSHYPWVSSQRQVGLLSQQVLPPCRVPAARLGLPVLGTRSDLCRGGLDPAWCLWLCPSMLVSGSWRKCQRLSWHLCQVLAARAKSPTLEGLCSAPGVQSLFPAGRELLGAGGQDGKGNLGPASPTLAALPEPLLCGEGKNSRRTGSFVTNICQHRQPRARGAGPSSC